MPGNQGKPGPNACIYRLNTCMITLFLFVLAFLVADRFSGGGLGWEKNSKDHGGPIGGRPIYYAGLALLVLAYFLFGWKYAVMTLGFTFWRLDGWKGHLTPATGKETFQLFLRHLYAAVLIPLAYFLKFNWEMALIAVPVWAALAAGLGYIGAKKQSSEFDATAHVEAIRGGLFGAMMYLIVM